MGKAEERIVWEPGFNVGLGPEASNLVDPIADRHPAQAGGIAVEADHAFDQTGKSSL